MGCFLACFGSSKNEKRRKYPNNVSGADPRFSSPGKPIIQSTPSLKQDNFVKPISPNLDFGAKPKEEEEELSLSNRVKSEGELSSGTRKKVTFNSNIRTYEHIEVEAPENLAERKKEDRKGIIGSFTEPSELNSVSENGSTLSSLGSYPSSHRYQNCRESDDEDEALDDEEIDDEESYLDDEDDDEGLYDDYNENQQADGGQEWSAGSFSSMESRTKTSGTCIFTNEVDDTADFGTWNGETKQSGLKGNAWGRSHYIHSVLNPVENVAQWKAVKAKRTPLLKQHKENSTLHEELPMPFFKDQSFKQQSKLEDSKIVEEIPVHASLSTWLVSSNTTPTKKAKVTDLEAQFSETSASSHGSNSVRSEERPILGAASAHELKQISAFSSPQRSPTRSKDDKSITCTVGAHWNSTSPVEESGSASSFKGIPNTTSKYREDKRVNWHSTPFETRLERALNKGGCHG